MRVGGKTERSYLREILVLAHETGHRLGAICKLRLEDLRLDRTSANPHGAIRWPGKHDKTGNEIVQPLTAHARVAVDAQLKRTRAHWLFPAPRDATQPCGTSNARRWLLQAERLARLPKLDGSAWHAYRRKWASERRHLPDEDVAVLAGWRDPGTMRQSYQHADPAKRQEVMDDRKEWRG